MKRIFKNIAAPLIFSGLFFVPVLSSAQTTDGMNNDNNNKSQTEFEVMEEMQISKTKAGHRRSYHNSHLKIRSRIITSLSDGINDYRSQAELEAIEELLYIQAISDLRKLSSADPVQASIRELSIISNLMASNYDKELRGSQNIR